VAERRAPLPIAWVVACACGLAVGCAADDGGGRVVRISASALGAEGEVLAAQLAAFEAAHPGVRVELYPTPDATDLRHQLYVQWLNAGVAEPDVLQLDVVWMAELAAAGWVLPLDRFVPDTEAFFPATIEANRWDGALHGVPWFVDVGMLYYRTDLVPHPPATFGELLAMAERVQREHGLDAGLLWQGARYEGLITTFVEYVGGFGGELVTASGEVVVDSPAATRALEAMKLAVDRGVVPPVALAMHEEETRLLFQNGRAAFLRNWPYCAALFADPARSAVAGRVGVTTMPAEDGGRPTAALGGAQLAINAHTRDPELAYALIEFLAAPAQMRERARVVGQYPTRPALFDEPEMSAWLGVPAGDVRRIIAAAVPRPVTPVYTQLSAELQIELHRALTGQVAPAAALRAAADRMRTVLASARLDVLAGRAAAPGGSRVLPIAIALAILAVGIGAVIAVRRRRREVIRLVGAEASEARLAWAFVTPALACIALIAVVPLAWTVWESFHHHDLRLPWLGRPFVGADNYVEAAGDGRFWAALGHTAIFTIGAVSLELVLGLMLALALDRAFRGRGLVRAAVLIPWAIPTVVAALVWSFMFQPAGITNQALAAVGAADGPVAWFNSAVTAWVPVILADVWKTTPFVALLLLAGLQGIDDSIREAARVDGASRWRQLWSITLPLLKPTIVVAVLFRVLDAFRVFDLVYVLTGGGPGTSTEPIAYYTFSTLLQDLRFGYGAALSVLIFLGAFGLAVLFIRGLGADLVKGPAR
jgi:ABC-type sugar transport system permease subunit/ABC-type glycerol-3-phosphate transport system substrate-binding protein